MLTILVAVVLSISATVLLGGAVSFREDPPCAACPTEEPVVADTGCGGPCCGEPGK
ncbi:MAG: hypothetical protein AB1346_04420 [Thermodesulfobacteriota bacterium]